jgi:transposase-like protein
MAQVLSREERGKLIAAIPSQIRRVDSKGVRGWFVKSQSGNGEYLVQHGHSGWTCKCPDYEFRMVECKHIWAVRLSYAIHREVEAHVIKPLNAEACVYCRSLELIHFGIRHNKYGDLQKFSCKACGGYFTVNVGFEHMRHNPQAVTTAMQLYFSGESLRNTVKALKLLGVAVSHVTVYAWIKKYVGLMEKYLDKITPQVSDTWRADEMSLKVKGNLKWLFALMDDETRFWIAKEVANSKFNHDTSHLFRMGKEVTEKKPRLLITDGMHQYHRGYLKEFYTHKFSDMTEHIQDIRFGGEIHNNKMERLNGEIRDREKVMRSLKKEDSPILSGYQLFHNYIRPHMALEGKTPADLCGIKVEGNDKWLTLIQNASHQTKINNPKDNSNQTLT